MANQQYPGFHENVEHYYQKFEKNNKYHCFENKDVEACHELGDYYRTVQKLGESLEAFKLNCFENEYGPSCYQYCLVKRMMGQKSLSADLYKAADIGCNGKKPETRNCVALGRFLALKTDDLRQYVPNGKQDLKQSEKLFEKACAEKIPEGCMAAFELFARDNQYKKALEFCELACEYKSLKGCQTAAQIHSNGSPTAGMKPDLEKAKYYRKKVLEVSPVKPLSMLYEKEKRNKEH